MKPVINGVILAFYRPIGFDHDHVITAFCVWFHDPW
jgi:hypothetical protein